MQLKVLKSELDDSVNFIDKPVGGGPGYFESRYVRRHEDYFIVYVSSQSGCSRSCGMCWLTSTGQTASVDASRQEFSRQIVPVMAHYRTQPPAKFAHVNFMARGEPLANKYIVEAGDVILSDILERVTDYGAGVPAKANISTIIPMTLRDKRLIDIFKYTQPQIYYSLYSLNEDFRKKWLPAALNPIEAILRLREYQEFTGRPVRIHYAFIKGENDGLDDVRLVADTIEKYLPGAGFNLVRYNPPDSSSQESDEDTIYRNMKVICRTLTGPVKIVSRVGLDIRASCGMFITADEL